MNALPKIPVVDARESGPVAVAAGSAQQMQVLLNDARRLIPTVALAVTDQVSKAWLTRAQNPYLHEIAAIAGLAGRAGAYTLNTGFEWCCTCGVGDDPAGGVRLSRVLDWRQSGVGRALSAVRQRGPAGDFVNLTWPGFVGVVTAMAPGRFAIALNQAPMRSWGLSWPGNWLAGRLGVWRSRALPPAHLLRQVCESAASYGAAREALCRTPLCLPAFFTLAGTRAGEGCVIERTENASACREAPAAVANHWVSLALSGRPRGVASTERQAQMEAALAADSGLLAWPIINRDTRMVAVLNPASGGLTVQGWEKEGPVTEELTLQSS